MTQRRIDDWRTLEGAYVEVRFEGAVLCSGYVETVTDDGEILWIQSPVNGRRLFEKAEFFEIWALEERAGFHYKVTSSKESARNSTLARA